MNAPTRHPIPALLADACHGPQIRLDQTSPRSFTAYPKDDETASALVRRVLEAGRHSAAVEGHEYGRQLGLVFHVYAVRFGAYRLRIVGPGRPPRGMFSNLRALERRVVA